MVRCEQRGFVAADVRLRAQRVHRLRFGRARDRVHRERGQPALSVAFDGARVAERGEKSQQRGAARDAIEFGIARLCDAHHERGVRVRGAVVGCQRRTGSLVRRIGIAGARAGAALDGEGVALLDELRDDLGHERDAPLARRAFFRDRDLHGGPFSQSGWPVPAQARSPRLRSVL